MLHNPYQADPFWPTNLEHICADLWPVQQVVALITIEVHARDVIEKLGKVGCTNANDFEWVSQLRFYWDRDQNDCVVKQVYTCSSCLHSCRFVLPAVPVHSHLVSLSVRTG